MVVFIFIQILLEQSESKPYPHRDPDQMLHSAVSGLGLYCFPLSDQKEARLISVNQLQRSADYHNYSVFKFGYI